MPRLLYSLYFVFNAANPPICRCRGYGKRQGDFHAGPAPDRQVEDRPLAVRKIAVPAVSFALYFREFIQAHRCDSAASLFRFCRSSGRTDTASYKAAAG